MIRLAHNHVVKDFDFQELAGAYQISRNSNVRLARLGFSARVIVRQYDGGGTGHDCQPEHGDGMHEQGIVSSNRNDVMAFDPAAGVQEQNAKAFTLRIEVRIGRHMQAPVIGGFLRRVAKLQVLGRGAFPQRSHLVFVR